MAKNGRYYKYAAKTGISYRLVFCEYYENRLAAAVNDRMYFFFFNGFERIRNYIVKMTFGVWQGTRVAVQSMCDTHSQALVSVSDADASRRPSPSYCIHIHTHTHLCMCGNIYVRTYLLLLHIKFYVHIHNMVINLTRLCGKRAISEQKHYIQEVIKKQRRIARSNAEHQHE